MIEAGLVVSRFLHYLACFVLFGAALFPFYAIGADAANAPKALSRIGRLIAPCAWIALATALLWFLFTAGGMAGSASAIVEPRIWALVAGTAFGRVWLPRIVLVGIVAALTSLRAPRTILVVVAGILVATLALVGHAVEGESGYAILHRVNDAAHLLCAAIWIGALAALVRMAWMPERHEHLLSEALARFSAIGLWVVALIAITGIVNAWFTVGPANFPRLLSSAYGEVLAAKLVLFGAMLVLAAAHRLVLAPRLASALTSSTPSPAARLRATLGAEALLGGLVIGAAAWLGTLPPPAAI